MRKVILLLIFVTIIVAEELSSSSSDNNEVSRKKKSKFPFHFLGYGFGIHALGILYWLKVKAIIISFIVGTAIVWGFRYFSLHKSCPEIVPGPEVIHGGPVIPYEGPSWPGHDHISYASPHSSDFFPEHEPYSAYGPPYGDPGSYGHSSPYGDSGSYGHSAPYGDSGPPEIVDATSHPHHRRVSKGRKITTEEQVSDIVFSFLGVGSTACRKRFLCEMEFRSNDNPLTRMAFRVVGRGIFTKYIRKLDDERVAQSFYDCGRIHSDCIFIEEDISEDETNEDGEEESSTIAPEVSETTSISSTSVSQRGVKSVLENILRRPSK